MNCPYCDNVRINDELEENNDLSIVVLKQEIYARICIISGNNKPLRLTFEMFDNNRWHTIITYYPLYCPKCGRKIIEFD